MLQKDIKKISKRLENEIDFEFKVQLICEIQTILRQTFDIFKLFQTYLTLKIIYVKKLLVYIMGSVLKLCFNSYLFYGYNNIKQ